MIRIVVVDDHPLVLEGLRARLAAAEDMEVAAEASDGEAALAAVERARPDLVLMDVSMPVMNGLEATAELRARHPDLRIIALTMHDEKEYVLRILKAGARGYILKDSRPSELLELIRRVHGGELVFSGQVAQMLATEFVVGSSAPPPPEVPAGLTSREAQVLRLVAEGRSNREIAVELELSVRTVESHRDRLMKKLDIRSTAGLTRYAITCGLVRTSP